MPSFVDPEEGQDETMLQRAPSHALPDETLNEGAY